MKAVGAICLMSRLMENVGSLRSMENRESIYGDVTFEDALRVGFALKAYCQESADCKDCGLAIPMTGSNGNSFSECVFSGCPSEYMIKETYGVCYDALYQG